jgi:hypothetical protein
MLFPMTSCTLFQIPTQTQGFYSPHFETGNSKLTYLCRNGWGASAVDAFSTAIVMQNADVTNTILSYIPTINFGQPVPGSQISLFETTIRYLAGMLSGDLPIYPFHMISMWIY